MTLTERITQRSASKILRAAVDAFQQKFTAMRQNSDMMLDKVDNTIFTQLTATLMEASQTAGPAGLAEYLQQNDTVRPTIINNGNRYRY